MMASIASAVTAVAAIQSDQQLLGLPVELLLHIARFLRTRDGLMYAATSRRLRDTTASFVYELYIQHEHLDNAPLWHAVRHTGMLDLAKRFLDAGADPNQPPHSSRHQGSRLSPYAHPRMRATHSSSEPSGMKTSRWSGFSLNTAPR